MYPTSWYHWHTRADNLQKNMCPMLMGTIEWLCPPISANMVLVMLCFVSLEQLHTVRGQTLRSRHDRLVHLRGAWWHRLLLYVSHRLVSPTYTSWQPPKKHVPHASGNHPMAILTNKRKHGISNVMFCFPRIITHHKRPNLSKPP